MENKKEISLEEFIKTQESGKENVKEYCIVYNGNKYTAMITGEGEYLEYLIWDESGSCSIYHWEKELPIPIEELKERMDNHSKGIRYCSCCGKPIQKDERCEGYFAGVYCMKCWTPALARQRDEDYRD